MTKEGSPSSQSDEYQAFLESLLSAKISQRTSFIPTLFTNYDEEKKVQSAL